MKIVNFTNVFFPYISGVSVSINSIKQEMEKRGHEVFIFAPYFKKNSTKIFTPKQEELGIYRYPSIKVKFRNNFYIAIKPYYKIFKILKKIDPDVIHSHQSFWLGYEALRYSKKLNKPLFYTYHANYEYYTYYLPIPFKKKITSLVLKRDVNYCNKCKAVIAPTNSVKEELIFRDIKTPVKVIPSGLNLEKFKKKNFKDIKKIRKKLGIKKNDNVILFLARLEKEKNIDLLIRIIKYSLKKDKKLKFLIVGDGFEVINLRKIKKIYPKNIIITGSVKHSQVPKIYWISDIFLQTSFTETQGITTIEAMASGLAVVALNAQATIDFIKNKRSGFLCGSNPKEFYKIIVKLFKNKALLKSIQKNSQLEVEKFNISKNCDKLIQVYKKGLSANR
ncbi:MAG: glycosyltransferase [Candidatus Moranbacteria bacterium]|nr:glycosyltransferase [Candidatus Moranbacteria bacterium]